jgi:hypothetical protein
MEEKRQPLTPEELVWYEVAFRLGKTVQELKELITPTEFEGWIEFLRLERNRNTKTHYMLAQIACQITKGLVKEPEKVQIEHFMLNLAVRQEEPEAKEEPPTEEEQEVHMSASKARWASALGIVNVSRN